MQTGDTPEITSAPFPCHGPARLRQCLPASALPFPTASLSPAAQLPPPRPLTGTREERLLHLASSYALVPPPAGSLPGSSAGQLLAPGIFITGRLQQEPPES